MNITDKIEEIIKKHYKYHGNAQSGADLKGCIEELSTLIQEERKEAVEGFEEKIFFGETIQYDGKNYISMEHIQKVLKEYLKERKE